MWRGGREVGLMAESAAPSAGRVFICYRREETAYAAGWLYDRLADRFGRDQIFKDIDSIELGDDFVEAITTAVGSCDVLLALIGEQWLVITDEHGTVRLDNPDDFVRLEIEAALTRNVRVIPILVAGARMPRSDQLPSGLAKLGQRHALELTPGHFESDTTRLLNVIDGTLAAAPQRARREAEEHGPTFVLSETVVRLNDVDPDERLPAEVIEIIQLGEEPLDLTARTSDEWIQASVSTDQLTVELRPRLGNNRGKVVVRDRASGTTGVLRLEAFVHRSQADVERPAPNANISGTALASAGRPKSDTREPRSSEAAPVAKGSRRHLIMAVVVTLLITASVISGVLLAETSTHSTRPPGGTSGASATRPASTPLAATLKNTLSVGHPNLGIRSVAFNGASTLAAGISDGTAQLWNTGTGQSIRDSLGNANTQITDKTVVAFNRQGSVLASGTQDGQIWLWNPQTGGEITDPLPTAPVKGLAFSPDGRTLASAGTDGTVRFWNTSTWKQTGKLQGTGGRPVEGLAFSPKGDVLATGDWDNMIKLWQADPPYQHIGLPLEGHTSLVLTVAFSHDGSILASASSDHTVRLWSVAKREFIRLLPSSAPVVGVAFSPVANILASGGYDNAVHLWDATTGERLADLPGDGKTIFGAVAFSSDGKTLASGTNNSSVWLWTITYGTYGSTSQSPTH
jgi:WD40 repeat protein